MKKLLALVACLSAALLSVAAYGEAFDEKESSVVTVHAAQAGQSFDEHNVALTIAAITDPHVGYGRNDEIFDNALNVLETFAPNGIDVFLSAGDNTQNGTKADAELFMSVLRRHYDLTKVPAVVAHGNHDTYWSGCMTTQQFYEAFGSDAYSFDLDKESAKLGNRHIEFNGYHFLTVQIQTFMPNINNITAETAAWLKTTLAQITQASPEKPIFLSCHSPQINTIYGSYESDATGVWGASKDFDAILSDYPQTILISGHTHYANNNELSIMQTGYTSFTPGGASHISANKDTVETSNGEVADARSRSQGTLVEVDKSNNVRITRIDFVQRKQIKQPWIVPAPQADKSHLNYYTAARAQTNAAPSFSASATADVVSLGSNKLRIDFSKAHDDDMVYSYSLALKNASGGTLRSVTTLAPWIEYPDPSEIPDVLSYTMTGVTVTYPCSLEIVAKDCWGAESAPLTVTAQDPTERDVAAAAEFDGKVNALGAITQQSYNAIFALRKEYNAMSYSRKQRVTQYAALQAAEKEFYRAWGVSDAAKENALGKEEYYNLISSSSRGGVSDSAYFGVVIEWKGATTNNCVGVNRAFGLEGLTLCFGGLELSDEAKMLGFMFSSVAKDKYTANENLLLQIDFETGKVYTANGKQSALLASFECLKYDNICARPFTMRFAKQGEAFELKIEVYGFHEAVVQLPSSALHGSDHLTDLNAVYFSVTPWAKSVTGQVELYAIYHEEPRQTPNDPATENPPKGCAGNAATAGAVTATFSFAAVAAVALKKRRTL